MVARALPIAPSWNTDSLVEQIQEHGIGRDARPAIYEDLFCLEASELMMRGRGFKPEFHFICNEETRRPDVLSFLGRMKFDGWSDDEIREHALVICRKTMSDELATDYLGAVQLERWARIHADAIGYKIPSPAPLPDVPPRLPAKEAAGKKGK